MHEIITIDESGKISAREVYEFLGLDPSNYAKWARNSILENPFAVENIDFEVFVDKYENPQGGRPSKDYKLTIDFAKKLCMLQKNERGEQARNYFIEVEKRYRAIKKPTYQAKSTSVGEITNLIKVLKGIMKDEKHLPEDIANMAQMICNQFNVVLPQNFIKKSPFEQIVLTITFEKN